MKKPSEAGMKVWITKYALSRGIFEKDAELCPGTEGRMISVRSDHWGSEIYHKPDWHESEQEAIQRAVIMAKNKQSTLQKQIVKVEKLRQEWEVLL